MNHCQTRPFAEYRSAIPRESVPVGRYAPTPSGRLHLGNLYCALLSWLSVKSRGGKILLRVEDLDRERLSDMKDRTAEMLHDLAALGLTFDGGYDESEYQSRRAAVYESALRELDEKGLLYPCYCSRAELHAATAPHLEDGRVAYDGKCRRFRMGPGALDRLLQNPDVMPSGEKAKKRPSIRIAVPHEEVTFTDGLRGDYGENLSLGGDPILRRADGVYAYQLAVTVDDGLTGVSEVLRGRDLLGSTPGQIWLLRTLGLPVPTYRHVPLLLAPDGRRLSKRDGDDALDGYLSRGFTPADVIGLIAYNAGLIPEPASLTLKELLPLYDEKKIPKEDIYLRDYLLKR